MAHRPAVSVAPLRTVTPRADGYHPPMSATPPSPAPTDHEGVARRPGATGGRDGGRGGARHEVSILLHSDNVATRDAVRAAVGRRPARDVEVTEWLECATGPAVVEAVDQGGLDLVILDGEAAKTGGMALCRQLKSEVYGCPPVLLLIGRPQDGWLASWSMADAVVSHPLDPVDLADGVAEMARAVTEGRPVVGHPVDHGRPGPHAD